MQGRTVQGRKLRQLREQADLRVRELAELVGCSPGHLKNIESATDDDRVKANQPSGILVHRLLRVLGTRLGRVLSIEDVTAPDDAPRAAA